LKKKTPDGIFKAHFYGQGKHYNNSRTIVCYNSLDKTTTVLSNVFSFSNFEVVVFHPTVFPKNSSNVVACLFKF
jgi:hypothetical protein